MSREITTYRGYKIEKTGSGFDIFEARRDPSCSIEPYCDHRSSIYSAKKTIDQYHSNKSRAVFLPILILIGTFLLILSQVYKN